MKKCSILLVFLLLNILSPSCGFPNANPNAEADPVADPDVIISVNQMVNSGDSGSKTLPEELAIPAAAIPITTTATVKAAGCPYNRWGACNCSDGSTISHLYWCDGDYDCDDGGDESDCSVCEEGYFSCETGHDVCLPLYLRCDDNGGDGDCPGGEDEADCSAPPPAPGTCEEGYYECNQTLRETPVGYPVCLHPRFRCDGEKDCDDGDDERNCPECQNGFHCPDDTCIYSGYVCDDGDDCEGGEDEDPILAGCPESRMVGSNTHFNNTIKMAKKNKKKNNKKITRNWN